MNLTLCLLIATYFCLLEVKCRSVQFDSEVHSVLEDGENKDVNHDPESNGRFSWKRLKPILRQEVQLIGNVKGETSEDNAESTKTASSAPTKLDGGNIKVNQKEEISLKAESQITNISSIKSELNKYFQNEVPVSESKVPEESSTDMTHLEMLQLDHPSFANDFPDNIISDILYRSSDSILLQVLNDNSSEIGSLEFDETSLLSEGGHVATLQDVSTIGFELLIDSETKRNSILAELLSSQSNLIDDDDFDNSTDEDDLSFATIQFNHSYESDLQEIATDVESTINPDVIEFEENESGSENTEFDTDETRITNIEFRTDEEAGTEVAEFDMDVETENIQFSSDKNESTTFSTGEMKNVINNESEASNSVQDDNVTETEGPKCPDPGWCVFWFLALDTCAKDSHCHGSLLCCMIGCSKTCTDPDKAF